MEITEEELNKKIEEAKAEATKGLLTQEQFNETLSRRLGEINEKHKKELEEKEKTAKMSAEEKQKHDFEVLTKERDEIKALLAQKEYKEKLTTLMSEKKVDNSFYEVFSNVPDLKVAGDLMDKLNNTMKAQVDAEIEKKLTPNVPKATNGETDVTTAQMRKAMGLN